MSASKTPVPDVGVLFVCLGNICRSPMAHGLLRKRLAETGLAGRVSVDSAGTGSWHIGEPPDRRAAASAMARGIDITDLRARRVCAADLLRFDHLIAMDHENLADLQNLAAETADVTARIELLGDFSPRHRGRAVADPYMGGAQGFERALDMIEDCVDGFIQRIS